MKREYPLPLALCSLGLTVVIMIVCLAVFHTVPQIPLLLGCGVAAGAGLLRGCRLRDIGSGVLRSIRRSLEAICILLLIGALIGVWISAGVVPTMVFYGLQIISPRWFLASAMVVCALISMVLGSWGTAGTVGLAFMGMAHAMGIPLPLTAGAVISGSYVGDKLSPLADTTNLAAAVAEEKVFTCIRHIFKVSAPMFLFCLVVYGLLGLRYGGGAVSTDQLDQIIRTLEGSFQIAPLNLLPLLILIICMLVRIPAIPSLAVGILSGGVCGLLAQHRSIPALLQNVLRGYVSHTDMDVVDELLTAGGVTSMAYTVSIVLLAMSLGGIMEETGQMEALVSPLLARTRSFVSLMAAAVFTSVGTNILLPDQYIAITLPGRMYAASFDQRSFQRKDLALAVGVGGALTSALVPWNTCGTFMAGILGVGTLHYLPFAFYNWAMPLAVVLYAAIHQRHAKRA